MPMPPASRMRGVEVKLDRAQAHIEDLRLAEAAINEECNDAIAYYSDPETGDHTIYITRIPPLGPYSAILGDALHNLRSALDYLAWQLVLASGGTPDDNTKFPIMSVPNTANRYGKSRPQIAPSVPNAVRDALDAVQPYHAPVPADHRLAALRHLDIVDKHRQLLVSPVALKQSHWRGYWETRSFNFGPYETGDEICRLIPDPEHPESHPDAQFTFQVRIREPDAGALTTKHTAWSFAMTTLLNLKYEVIPIFEKFLR